MLVGVDVINVERFEKFINDEKFLNKYFSDYEKNYISSRVHPAETMAGIYASKEAFLKALGIGIGGGIDLKDIEVGHEKSGRPNLRVINSENNEVFRKFQISKIDISISHTDSVATAMCIVY